MGSPQILSLRILPTKRNLRGGLKMTKTSTYTMYRNRNDVEVAKSLLRMTKAELIDEILGTYSKEDLIEIGFLVRKEA
jgi:hypothetical protein